MASSSNPHTEKPSHRTPSGRASGIGAALAAFRHARAGPVVTAFADWLAEQRPRALPKSPIGEAFTDAASQWPSFRVYLMDARPAIDNGPAEQAVRPLAVGRRNWLPLGGDGGLRPASVLLSVAASARQHAIDPWAD